MWILQMTENATIRISKKFFLFQSSSACSAVSILLLGIEALKSYSSKVFYTSNTSLNLQTRILKYEDWTGKALLMQLMS